MSDVSNGEISRRAFGALVGLSALLRSATAATATGTLHDNPATDATPAAPDEICDLTAVDLASRLRRKQLSAHEVMSTRIGRIQRVNPKINAIVALVAERALAEAKKAERSSVRR